ncbi:two-pore potassium channel 5-like [Papaver somniferum]|uniref:two-pore potassium channel 5-like n=1 Tax=Papaver somniferum TaxID=3469 RepID=UPI000E6F5372|nr:two-pore potassium channel 5-like [Papaver somniferum]
MERQSLLASQPKTQVENHLLDEEIQFKPPQSIISQVIFEDLEAPFLLQSSSSSHHLDPSADDEYTPPERVKHGLTRSRTAPAMAIMRDFKGQTLAEKPKLVENSMVRQAFFLLVFYLIFGVTIYSFNQENFSGIETHPVVDALYFCIVTMCTIGYGDIAPLTPATKIFACVFVLVGFGFIDILLSGVLNYALDLQETLILANSRVDMGSKANGSRKKFSARNYIFDVEKGRMRIRMKVGLALVVVIMCIGMGAMVLHFVEKLDVIDSIYLSVMSVTTVGYGDRAFKTLQGRLFASFWLLSSTLAVARAFLYLAELRIDKRHRSMTKWVLHRQITVEDLLAADINNNGFISKSEYVILKLKEMGKINEKDILLICNQFDKIDPNNSGRITLPELLDSQRSI